MNDEFLLIVLFLVGLAALGFMMSTIMNLLTGWTALARSYRGRLPHVEASAGARMSMRGLSRTGLTFTVGPYGIGLLPILWETVLSPPLALPWEAIHGCRRYRLFGRLERFTFMVDGVEVTATGAAVPLLDDAWRKWGREAGVLRYESLTA